MTERRLLAFNSATELVAAVVSEVSALPAFANVGVTGGRVGRSVNERILATRLQPLTMWFSDERFVPSGDPDRNDAELAPTAHVTVETARGSEACVSAAQSAMEYEKRFFSAVAAGCVDMAIFSVGDDGHIASLFPSHPLLESIHRGMSAIDDSPKPPPTRITWTLPLVNSSPRIYLLAAGAEKAELARRIMDDDETLPASLAQGRESTFVVTCP